MASSLDIDWHAEGAPAQMAQHMASEGISTLLDLALCFESVDDLLALLPPLCARDRDAVIALHERALGARRLTSGAAAVSNNSLRGFLAGSRKSLSEGLRSWATLPTLGQNVIRRSDPLRSVAHPHLEVPCESRGRGVKRDATAVGREDPSEGMPRPWKDPSQKVPCVSLPLVNSGDATVHGKVPSEVPLGGRSAKDRAAVHKTVTLLSGPSGALSPVKPLRGRWHHRSSKENWWTAAGAHPKYSPANDEQEVVHQKQHLAPRLSPRWRYSDLVKTFSVMTGFRTKKASVPISSDWSSRDSSVKMGAAFPTRSCPNIQKDSTLHLVFRLRGGIQIL